MGRRMGPRARSSMGGTSKQAERRAEAGRRQDRTQPPGAPVVVQTGDSFDTPLEPSSETLLGVKRESPRSELQE